MKPSLIIIAVGLPMVAAVSGHAGMTKVLDFPSAVGQAARPYSALVQVGGDLWFTTESGGDFGFGSIARWSFSSGNLTTEFAAMNTVNGNTPQGTPFVEGELLYVTTTRGGTGDRGVLATYNMTNGDYTVLHNSLGNSPNTNPNTLIGNPVVVDRGTHKEAYFLTRSGGTTSLRGTVQKTNLSTNVTATVTSLPGPPGGQQPLQGGFTRVGSNLYFTTFTGGNTGTGYPNGAGTLMVLDLASDTVASLAALPAGDGSTRFPANNPAYDPGTNALYFTTAGTSLQPGALMRFDLTTSTLSTLYELTGAATTAGPFPDGRFAYSDVAIYGNDLYFTTIQGGAYGGGTLNRFSLSSMTFEVVWNLGNDTFHGVHWGSEPRGGPVLVSHSGQDYLAILTRTGGVNNQGTLLLYAIPEPSLPALLWLGCSLLIGRRRA